MVNELPAASVTWFGCASFKIECPMGSLLVDPFMQWRKAEHRTKPETYDDTENIILTHGHFDHLYSLPMLLERNIGTVSAPAYHHVFCTATPAKTLHKRGAASERISVFAPGDSISVGGMTVRTYQGRHARFDRRLVRKTVWSADVLRYAGNVPSLLHANVHCPEHHETVFYEVMANGLRIQVMGSMGFDKKTDYPVGADLLILPYQGKSDLLKEAIQILERLQPKHVVLSHFDNAFPPLSKSIDTEPLIREAARRWPEMTVICPGYAKIIKLYKNIFLFRKLQENG